MVQNEQRDELKGIRVEWGGQPPRKFLPPLRFGRRRLVPHSSEPCQSSRILNDVPVLLILV